MRKLVPIRVGMILSSALAVTENITCPHTRGDDPAVATVVVFAYTLSPYAWG